MPSIDITADASKGVNEAGRFSKALDAVTDRIKNLNSVSAEFNKKGELVSATVRSQTGAFETLTQTINKAGKVVSSVYTKNEEAARAAADRDAKRAAAAAARQDRLDKADETRAARAAARFDRETRKRNGAIDKEIAAAEKARAKADAIANRPPPGGNALLDFFGRLRRNFTQFVEFKAFHLIADGIKEGVKAAREFQIQISLIRTISQDNQQSFGKFGRDIRGVSDQSGFDIKDVGKAFYDTTSNQVAKGANVAPFVKSATDLARVTGSELPDSVNLLSSAINAYSLSASDAERISAIFFRTIDEGRIVSSELANTFGRIAVLGSNLGVPLEDLNAILAITTQKGLKTSDAMTLLTNLLIKIEKPTEASAAFFKNFLGADSGEQAISIVGGIIPLINKIVAAVKSGQVDVSAFFDEIRGRKQFGVFEQSGGEIEKFAAKLKDTQATVKNYKDAIAIRGESPADALNKELNKLSNIFKVDLGQTIVKTSADLIAWIGGVDNASANVKAFSGYLGSAGKLLLAYGVVTAAVTIKNYAFVTSVNAAGVATLRASAGLRAFTIAAFGALKVLAPLAAGYYIGKRLIGDPQEIAIEAKAIEGTTEKLEQLRAAAEKYRQSQLGVKADPLASFTASRKQIEDAYSTVIGLLGQATIVNDRFLDSAKSKARETAEAVKAGFSTYTDIFKDKISKINKSITDARQEIEKSQKSVLGFQESLDDILFRTKEKYANDDFGLQKQTLNQQRIAELRAKKDRLLAEGTEESIAEARKIYDEIAKREEDLFNLKIDLQKKQFENYLNNNPEAANRPGGNIFSVDPTELQNKLGALAAERAKDEERIVKAKKESIKVDEKALETAKKNERNVEAAIKKYEALDLFTKNGQLKDEFKDKGTGRFDRKKFDQAYSSAEAAIRAPGGPTFEQRVQLEQLLVAKKKALIEEVELFQRAEDLKTAKTKILNDKDTQEKQLENLKKNRAENLAKQHALLESFGAKSLELAGFANAIKNEKEGRFFKGAINNEDAQRLDFMIKRYNDFVVDIINNPIIKDGVQIFDPRKAEAAYNAYSEILQNFDAMAKKYGFQSTPSATIEGGGKLGPDAAKQAFKAQIEDFRRAGGELFSGVDLEKKRKAQFEETVIKPLDGIKKQFPELSKSADEFSNSANQSFRALSEGGVEDLRRKLMEVQKLMQPPNPGGEGKGPGKVGFLEGDDSGYAYAATGGIVGAFPGQPRGQDVYPIWAAKGERIIDARTSAMYAPMLDAIMQRRMPQYMAGGGIVGGDTHVGDINVTVNGARTNSDTARIVGQSLERQLRLNNIRLERKK